MVESIREMSRLAEITRSDEMVARLLKSSRDADDINKLANVPEWDLTNVAELNKNHCDFPPPAVRLKRMSPNPSR